MLQFTLYATQYFHSLSYNILVHRIKKYFSTFKFTQSQMKIYNTLFLLYGSNISFYGNKISMGTEFFKQLFLCVLDS